MVDAALKVRANDTAAALAGGMTLDMAAVVEEFSDDEDAVARLERTAAENPQSFTHTAQRMRDDRRRAAEVAEATAEAEVRGLKITHRERHVLRLQRTDRPDQVPARTTDGESLTVEDTDAAHIVHTYSVQTSTVYLHAEWKAAGFIKLGAPAPVP